MVSEGKSKTFLALKSQFSIFYSPEQDKNKAEESFLFIFIFKKHIQCRLALYLEMSSDVERQHCAIHVSFTSPYIFFTVRTGKGKNLWGLEERTEIELCLMGYREAITMVMDTGIAVTFQQALAFLPAPKLTFLPTALMTSDGLHTPPCSAVTTLLLRAIACQSHELLLIVPLCH